MDKIKGLTRDEWGVTLQGMACNALSTVLRASKTPFCCSAKDDAMQSGILAAWRWGVNGKVKFLSKRILYLIMCKQIRFVLFANGNRNIEGPEIVSRGCVKRERILGTRPDDSREKLIVELLDIPRFAPVVSAYLIGMTKREMRKTLGRRKLESIMAGIRDYVSLKHADFEL